MTDASLTLLGKICADLEISIELITVFADGLELIANYNFNKATQKFTFVNSTQAYTKAIASTLDALLYQQFSMLKVFVVADNVDPVSNSKVLFEYNTKVVGSAYLGDGALHNIFIYFTRALTE